MPNLFSIRAVDRLSYLLSIMSIVVGSPILEQLHIWIGMPIAWVVTAPIGILFLGAWVRNFMGRILDIGWPLWSAGLFIGALVMACALIAFVFRSTAVVSASIVFVVLQLPLMVPVGRKQTGDERK